MSMYQRILVTDDDPILRTLYRKMLKGTATFLQIDFAATKQEAMERIRTSGYDLALLDIELGETDHDGFDVLRAIRARRKSTEVMMMSSMVPEAVRERCLELGASGFTPKNEQFLNNIKSWVTSKVAENDLHCRYRYPRA